MKRVYILEFDDKIKVGITENINLRISAIQCASGSLVKKYFTVAGTLDVERKMHNRLKNFHIAGEFFKFDFISACKILCEICGICFNEQDIIRSDCKPSPRTGRPNSRADYMKKRRETIGQFSVSVPREKLVALDKKLKEKGQTKTAWLNEKIDEEIGK